MAGRIAPTAKGSHEDQMSFSVLIDVFWLNHLGFSFEHLISSSSSNLVPVDCILSKNSYELNKCVKGTKSRDSQYMGVQDLTLSFIVSGLLDILRGHGRKLE